MIDGARAWRHFVVGCTKAYFVMPQRVPNLHTSLAYCSWYHASNSEAASFRINTSFIRLLSSRRRRKAAAEREPRRRSRSWGSPGSRGLCTGDEGSGAGDTTPGRRDERDPPRDAEEGFGERTDEEGGDSSDIHFRRHKRKAPARKPSPRKKLATRRSPRHVVAEPVLIEDDGSDKATSVVSPSPMGVSAKGKNGSFRYRIILLFVTKSAFRLGCRKRVSH